MFVKTKRISDYLPEEQVNAINYMINDNIQKTIKNNPVFSGMNLGQILVTNCTSLEGLEVNALVSFRYQYDREGVVVYFLPEEVVIYDDNNEEGINYMLDHRKTKDELARPEPDYSDDTVMSSSIAAHAGLSKAVEEVKTESAILARLREEFNTVGVDCITGKAALKIIEKVFKETK